MPLMAQFPLLMASYVKHGHDAAAEPLQSRGDQVGRAQLTGSAEHFRIIVRGSNWTVANQGVLAESVPTTSSDTAFKRFCDEHYPRPCLPGGTDCSTGSTCIWIGSWLQHSFFPVRIGTLHGVALVSDGV